MERIKRQ